ncbi:phosphodiesterase/nucleotide pyrophosphatase domain protein [Halobacterium hubeiense]|uniref:Phosphodiesterase/nucleotide pyrophosphatase domain protein n=1 Tax=Halobacterium hubeiense TaxID=1407499 RepID=A0A0U5H2W3_9EURY|nr:alkaline phosphatase family protein [Halobacterium hubeiense]CQH57448.1 phosphodiesterase/nucleotide pyrophosphatase domain protein [Halobacterium hubeiense]
MLDTALAGELAATELAEGFVRPDYDGFCFSRVPATAASMLDADLGATLPDRALDGVDGRAEHVLVLFVDALGFRQFERVHGDVSLLRSFVDAGRVTPLTSTYPSETAACVTTMHTGRDPVEHGLLGWNGYDPVGDTVYETLPYAAKDDGNVSVSPGELFDGDPIYDRLGQAGVDSHVVEPDYGTGYDDGALVGATTHHYERATEFALAVRDVLRSADAPSYTYAYYPTVDAVAHERGPDSELYGAQVAAVCDALERALGTLDDDVAEETAVCLVADHGQVPIRDADRTELDATGVLEYVPADCSGTPLVLGGPRNVHLRVTDEEAARACLSDCDALVLSRQEALAERLWGRGEPGPAFERNSGDLVVVPREGGLWYADEAEQLSLAGMHGGLHPDEALVPFGVARLDDLV